MIVVIKGQPGSGKAKSAKAIAAENLGRAIHGGELPTKRPVRPIRVPTIFEWNGGDLPAWAAARTDLVVLPVELFKSFNHSTAE